MGDRNQRTIKAWLESAEYDLETARVMLSGKRFLYVGFMCHITIEKMLKAIIIKITGTTPPYIHDLEGLARESGIINDLSKDQLLLIEELDPMNIKARYPKEKDRLSKTLTLKKCQYLLNKTEELHQWLMRKSEEK